MQDSILELLGFFGGICIIKSADQSPLAVRIWIFMCKVVIQQGRFGMADVQVTRWLRGKASHDTTVDIFQTDIVASTRSARSRSSFLDGVIELGKSSHYPRIGAFDKIEPPTDVGASSSDTSEHTISPYNDVCQGQAVTNNVGAKCEMRIELLQGSLQRSKVENSHIRATAKPLIYLNIESSTSKADESHSAESQRTYLSLLVRID